MPIDPNIISQGLRPLPQFDPMQTLAQISTMQNMALQRQEAQQRIALANEELKLRQEKAKRDVVDLDAAHQGEALVEQYRLGKLSHEQILELVGQFPDPRVRNSALTTLTAIRDKASEIQLRESTAGKNDVEALRMKRELIGDTARKIRDDYEYSPGAIDIAFHEFATLNLYDPKMLDEIYNAYKSSDDPEAGKKMIDGFITQAGEEYTLGGTEQRKSVGGKTLASGAGPVTDLKTDFNLFLPLYARDQLKIDTSQPGWEKQLTSANYEAAKKRYEDLNNTPWHGFSPSFILTSEGWGVAPKSGPGVGTVTPLREAGTPGANGEPAQPGRQAQRPLPAAVLTQQRAMRTAKVVLEDLRDLAKDVQWKAGAMARLTAPADRARAKLNLDDALSLYQSSLNAAAPLLSRGYGHTGVLTELDTMSTKEAVGTIGESESLITKKFAHALALMDTIAKAGEAWDAEQGGGSSTATPAATTPAATAPGVDPDFLKAFPDRVQKP